MLADIKENIVLYDWLTFTSKKHDPWELVEALGLDDCSWMQSNGRYGYKEGLYFDHIAVYYEGREDMGVCCEMSGQGCRAFESYTKLPEKWKDLFAFILVHKLHVTRLDVAFDDHTGILDIERICEDTRRFYWVSRFRMFKIEESGKNRDENTSKSIRFGTRQSKTLVRIYDKAQERGYTDGRHWIRCEMQLKDERAAAFIDGERPVGETFCGVLFYYLRFVEPTGEDTNISRWKLTDYWEKLMDGIEAVRLCTAPGVEYNVESLKHCTVDMWGNAIACAIDIFGIRDFVDLIRSRTCRPNKKYELLLNSHYAHLEKLAEEAAQRLNLDSDKVEIMPGVFQSPDFDKYRAELEERRRRLENDWTIDAKYELFHRRLHEAN